MITKEHLEKGFKKYTDLFFKVANVSIFTRAALQARSGKEKGMCMEDAPVHLFRKSGGSQGHTVTVRNASYELSEA